MIDAKFSTLWSRFESSPGHRSKVDKVQSYKSGILFEYTVFNNNCHLYHKRALYSDHSEATVMLCRSC